MKKSVVISKDFYENVEIFSNLIIIALQESTSIPQLSVDGFLMRVHLLTRNKLEID
jgi:hypothetical protein